MDMKDRLSKACSNAGSTFDKYMFEKGWWIYLLAIMAVIFIIGISHANPQNPFLKP